MILATIAFLYTTSLPLHFEAEKPIKKGSLRWSIKTGSDPDASRVNMTPKDILPKDLVAIPRPNAFPRTMRPSGATFDNARFAPAELQVYRVRAKLIQFKEEADGDFHCAMEGPDGTPFVAEISKPEFASSRGSGATKSIWLQQIKDVRAKFLAHYGLTERTTEQGDFTPAGEWVMITGPAYFDDHENQNHEAANTIEIHPIHSISWDGIESRVARSPARKKK